jgi:hypothetical protein
MVIQQRTLLLPKITSALVATAGRAKSAPFAMAGGEALTCPGDAAAW